MSTREFPVWLAFVLIFGMLGIGVLFGLDALGLLVNQFVSGFVGMALGCLAVVAAYAALASCR